MGKIQMNITLIVQSLAGLVALLAILMFFLFFNFNDKKPALKKEPKLDDTPQKEDTSLEALRKIIRNKKATASELEHALSLVLKHHGTIHPKLGTRSHPDFDSYGEILFSIARHQHVNKDIILNFDKELEKRNPSYKKEINDALMRGLNSRGV
jgi:hypothetical protein